MLLSELIEGLPITIARGDAARTRVGDLTEDSRTAMPGSMFVARAGLVSDGRAYAASAIAAGAVAVLTDAAGAEAIGPAHAAIAVCDDVRTMTAVLAERMCGNPSRRLLVAGVTGTNGKSTVAHLVHGLLNRSGVRCGVIGTVGIDDGTEFAASAMTTPPAIELSRTLATMVDAGCEAAVMEVSSHALDQGRAAAMDFNAAVFTNITGDHADYHPSFEHYFQAKQSLLRMLTGDRPGILNADDAQVAASAACVGSGVAERCAVVDGSAGGDQHADWTVERTGVSIEGESLAIRRGSVRLSATVPLIGAFNAMNVVQAVAAAWSLLRQGGLGEAECAERLDDALSLATAPKGRLEPVHGARDRVAVFVDYAHTDDALDRVLASVRAVCAAGSELSVVFGCGGDRDRGKRPRMGRVAAARADRVIVTSDNPRRETPSSIVDEILEGIPRADQKRVIVHIDRERAIREAVVGAADGGVVVIAGKGHETEQVSSDGAGALVTRRFVDQEVAARALAERARFAQDPGRGALR